MLFLHVGKRPDDIAELSYMLENVPTTSPSSYMLENVPTASPSFPTCWKTSRRRRRAFLHVGKCPDGVAKVSYMLESFYCANEKRRLMP